MSGFRMLASLDRFIKKIVIKNILFMPKRSRLGDKKHSKSGQICPVLEWLENRTYLSGFRMVKD